MTDITDSALLFINPLSVIRPGPNPTWSKSGLTRIFCVIESDWFGSNRLKFCFILFNPYRVVCSVCTAVSLVRR